MNSSLPGQDDWNPCPPGLIQEVAKQGVVSKWSIAKVAFFGSAMLVTFLAGAIYLSQPSRVDAPSFSVEQCNYVQAQLGTLLADEIRCGKTKSKICNHIVGCKSCRDAYKALLVSSECPKKRPKAPPIKRGPCNCP